MIVFHILILTFYLLFGQIQNESNIGQNYDTNDWIPIEPTNRRSDNQQVAQGRVLNLETPPNQRFFPDEDYLRKQHHHQQPQQQQQKGHRPTRVQHPYRFETVVVPPPPQPPTRQLQQQSLSQVLVAPPPTDDNQPNLYESLNPGVINHELLPQLPLITTLRTPTTTTTRRSRPNVDNKENVQLLYVPLENLRKNQQVGQQSQNYYHQTQLPVRFNEEIQKNRPQLLENIQQDFIQQALAAHKLQQQLQQQPQELPQIVSSLPPLPPPVTTTTTTTTIPPKPKKRKPHQPPLAVYMEKLGSAEINDVLRVLKNAKSITVQDSITQQSPQVFVGPYNLNPPEGYTKFPLPYISNVDGNRIERHRIEDLPFFVAPLSYRAPDGYSKIPLPSPHVGSVIVKQNGEAIQAQIITTTSAKNFVGSPQIDPKIQQQFLPVFQEIKPNLQENPREYLPKYQQKPVETSTLNYEKYPQSNNYEIETLPIHRFSPTTTPPTTTTTTTTAKQIITTSNQPESRDFVPFQPQNQYRLEVNPQQINHGFSQYELEQINRFIAENPEYHVSSVSSNLPTQSSPNVQQFVAETPEFYPNPASVSTLPPVTRPPPRFVGENTQLHHLNPVSGSTLPPTPNRFVAETPEFQQSPISGSTLRPLAPTSVVNTENYEIVTKSRSKSTPPPQFLAETPAIHSDPITGTRIRLESHPSALEVGGNYENRPSTPPPSHRFLTETPQFQQSPISGSTLRPISRPTTSTTIGSDDYEIVTKPRNRSRKRQRGRPSTRTTTTTTLRPVTGFDNEHYTVLEEFNIKPQITTTTTTTTTPKYTTEIETVPANVYKLEPVVFQQQPQQQQDLNHQHYQQQQELNHHHYQQQQQEQQPEVITDGPHYSPLIYNRGQISGTTPTISNNYQLVGLLNDIQDQSVKSLLNPKLLIPTTEPIQIPTTATTTTTTPEPVIITTTTRRSRGRQRITTTATPHRRVVNRRRPTRLTTTTTERPTTDFESSRAVSRQRFRTRGRPLTTEIPKNTQIFDNHHQQQQQQSINFQEIAPQIEPQSYMQFEHTVNDEEVIKVKVDGERDDHDNVDNVKLISEIEQSQPVIDVQINHPIDDGAVKFVETTEKQPQTIQSGGVYPNHKYHQEDNERLAILQPTRGNGNGRLRSRSRIVQTTPTTTTTTSTTMTTIRLENQNQKEEEEKEEDEEFYGFIRPPNYNKPSSLILTTTQQQQPRFSIEGEQSSPTPSAVRFIGEIRPKYQTTPTPTTTSGNFDEQFTVKSRSRIRIPQRRLNPQFNEIQTTPITTTRRISNIGRGRNRGHSYYQSPLSSSGEDFNQNDSVEGGNYPVSYLKNHSFPPQTITTTTTTTTTTEKPTFQITIDPDGYTVVGEENEEDQEINPSLYRPKWVQASAQALQHDEIIDETQNTTTPTTKKAPNYRRKGVWKLVKKQPIEDQFEVAESQNYQSVLNLFGEITKISTTTPTTTIEPTTTTTTTTTESSLFDTIYNMFSDLNKSQQANNETTSTADDNVVDKVETTTTTITPTFPEEITEATILTELPETTTTTTTTTTQNIGQKYEVEPWEMKEVKTSTSTEISHETEICYKGRCVKTKDKN